MTESSKAYWPTEPLGSLCEVSIGRTPARARPDYWGRGEPWLSIGDMSQEGRDLTSTKESITPKAIKECRCRPVEAGTVLLSFKLSIGKVGVAKRRLYTNEAIAALPIRDPSRLSPDFLYWALKATDLTIGRDRAAKGQTLNKAKLLKILVPVPPLSEQRRIAAILDMADEVLAKRRAALDQLDTLTQSTFLDMFGDSATKAGNWPTEPLGGLLESGPQNGLYRPASDYGSGTPIVRIDAFYDGVLGDTNKLKRVRISDSERKSYELRVGDILINRVNSREYLGKSALVPKLAEATVFESNMMRLGVDRKRLNPVFVIHFLQTNLARRHFQMCAKDAVNQSSINQQDVQALPVPLPPLPIQDDFASLVDVFGALRGRHLASEANARNLFASIQHRAFRGEL